jgi:pimeloyl-ACP methyl ester carboxylesterase
MDHWDPAVTDGLARDRAVILFNNAGVSSSSGEVPTTFEQMGANAVAFSRALGLNRVDVLGFSIGGMVAQEIALQAPDLVRKLILVGTDPRGGQGMESLTLVAQRIFGAAYDPPEHLWLAVLFSPSEAGQAAGGEFLKRKHLRQEGRDPEVNDKVSPAQIEAMDKWGVQQEGAYGYLKTIKQPTLIVNGSNDVIMPTINSFINSGHRRRLRLRRDLVRAPPCAALRKRQRRDVPGIRPTIVPVRAIQRCSSCTSRCVARPQTRGTGSNGNALKSRGDRLEIE